MHPEESFSSSRSRLEQIIPTNPQKQVCPYTRLASTALPPQYMHMWAHIVRSLLVAARRRLAKPKPYRMAMHSIGTGWKHIGMSKVCRFGGAPHFHIFGSPTVNPRNRTNYILIKELQIDPPKLTLHPRNLRTILLITHC